MAVAPIVFRQQFDRFDRQILRVSGRHFVSFHEGLADEREYYKEAVRSIARDRLGFGEWRSRDVGTGKILDRLIKSIEISKGPDVERNNLVAWQARYGAKSQSHRAILDARGDRSARRRFEKWCFEFFQDDLSDQEAFEEFAGIAGRRYDLVAYLFFLKDWKRFMPIAPTTFDAAFSDLGIDLKTSKSCSWDNYSRYNAALADIRNALRNIVEIDARLIDAHSFCWILTRLKSDDRAAPHPAIPMPQEINNPRPVSVTFDETGSDRITPRVSEDEFIERDAAQRRLGKIAEDVAFAAEQRRFHESGRSDLARLVELVSDRPALGYDILSFELDGNRRYIEAKATRRSGQRLQFYLTRNEWAQCRRLPNYHFYLVIGAELTRPTVWTVQARHIRTEGLAAVTYLASLEQPD